jgi:putative hemolysin
MMTTFIVSTLVAVVVSLLCSLSEAVLLSVNSVKLETDKNKGAGYATILGKLKLNINRPISAILILNTIAHTGGSTFAGNSFGDLYGDDNMWIFSLIFTVVILFVTEIFPKVMGVAYADQLAPLIAKPLYFSIKALYPLVYITEKFSNLLTGNRKKTTSYSIEDIHTIARSAQLEDVIDRQQEKIIIQTSALKRRTLEEIMLPIDRLIFIPENIGYDDYYAIAEKYLHTRYPVSRSNSPQDLVGYLNLKEISLQKEELLKDGLSKFIRPLLFVQKNMTVAALLRQFIVRKNHLAIVQDQQGKNIGMLTLEDLVEEVVGDIRDEFD